MTWEYALIGLVVGIIIGAVAMRFGNRKLRQQQALQYFYSLLNGCSGINFRLNGILLYGACWG